MRSKDVKSFDTEAYRGTVRSMAARGESVHDTGRTHQRQTGHIHELVDVTKNRGSHNAMVANPDGTCTLTKGIAMPMVGMFDGTGSTAQWLADFFHAAERQYNLLMGASPRYQVQQASGVMQDVCDKSPVVQLSQFEPDERSAEQVRLLLPDGNGGDATEDYDIGLVAGLTIYADLMDFYGLKGYFTLTADEIGRGFVTARDAKKYLGYDLQTQGDRLSTADLCRQLLGRWHLFYLQVGGIQYTTDWWNDVLGTGRVIQVRDPRLLAEVRAGLVYVTEATQPTAKGLAQFLRNESDQGLDAHTLDSVWRTLQDAQKHFGAQARLSSYHEIPLPGTVFAHYRDPWPIGHPRAGENPSGGGVPRVAPEDVQEDDESSDTSAPFGPAVPF